MSLSSSMHFEEGHFKKLVRKLMLLFIIYDIPFDKKLKKADLVARFVEHILPIDKIKFPQLATQECLDALGECGGYRRLVSLQGNAYPRGTPQAAVNQSANDQQAEVDEPANNPQTEGYQQANEQQVADDEQQVGRTRKRRRPNFKPTEEDAQTLRQDIISGLISAEQARRRAAEFRSTGFNVERNQIRRWYTRNNLL